MNMHPENDALNKTGGLQKPTLGLCSLAIEGGD
jgi:hypothetical protein